MATKKFKSCREQPNSTLCQFLVIVRSQVSGGSPINNELLRLIGELEKSLEGPEDPTGEMIVEIVDVLRQMGRFDQALQLTNIVPQLTSPTSQENALLLSKNFTLQARILDQMSEHLDEAASAFELANHYAFMAGMLRSQQ